MAGFWGRMRRLSSLRNEGILIRSDCNNIQLHSPPQQKRRRSNSPKKAATQFLPDLTVTLAGVKFVVNRFTSCELMLRRMLKKISQLALLKKAHFR